MWYSLLHHTLTLSWNRHSVIYSCFPSLLYRLLFISLFLYKFTNGRYTNNRTMCPLLDPFTHTQPQEKKLMINPIPSPNTLQIYRRVKVGSGLSLTFNKTLYSNTTKWKQPLTLLYMSLFPLPLPSLSHFRGGPLEKWWRGGGGGIFSLQKFFSFSAYFLFNNLTLHNVFIFPSPPPPPPPHPPSLPITFTF